ncbi:ABC transporter permease subunit [bacterium]|nr:ABC transporter permease subunit [bacterium]
MSSKEIGSCEETTVNQKVIMRLALLRLHLLLRQKLAWITLLVGAVLIFLCLIVANVSFVSPAKIFWDFALGISFLAQHFMAIFLAATLLGDEQQKRTLHLLLVNGASRGQWLLGNLVGVFVALCLADLFWFLISGLTSFLFYGTSLSSLLIQVKLLQAASVLVVLAFSQFFSVVLKPMLATVLSIVLTIFLYSISSVKRVFADETAGHLIGANWSLKVLNLSKVLPPLEWYDWKIFVGYTEVKSWSILVGLLLFALLWTTLISGFSIIAFRKKDL